VNTVSTTINFWIKPSILNNGAIFRYSSTSPTSDIFSISMASAGSITAQIGTESVSTTTALFHGTWSFITVSFVVQNDASNQRSKIVIYINGALEASGYDFNVGPLIFASTDIIRIGGPNSFLGSFKQLSIYSPGSLKINSRIFYLYLFF